jgi:hypothetical protein
VLLLLLLWQVGRGAFDADDVKTVTNHAYRLLIAGPLLWLLGSIHNAFQVYEKVDTKVQLLQKTVAIPFLLASTLFVISGILAAENWPSPAAAIKIQVWQIKNKQSILVIVVFRNQQFP